MRRRLNLRRSVKRLLLFTNIGAVLALFISTFSYLIDPNTILWPAFLGLSFLPILLVNTLFIMFWLFAKPKLGFIGLITIALCWSGVRKHMVLWPSPSEHLTSDVSIMTFNVRLFDLYNWGGNKETRNDIFRYLDEKNPDILCFQEFFNTNDPAYFNTLDTMLQFLSSENVHDQYTAVLHYGKSKFGIATLSRFPILYRGHVPLDTAANNVAIFTDLEVNGDTIRVFNIHLASVYISGIENDLSKHIETNDQDGQIRDIELMTKKLSGGFKRRAKQSQVIRRYMDASPHPVIVCGDLNDTPGSYAYAHLSEGLVDAFVTKGFGGGSTYIGLFPGLRIDFMLVDPSLSLSSFSTERVALSDHRPLITTLSAE